MAVTAQFIWHRFAWVLNVSHVVWHSTVGPIGTSGTIGTGVVDGDDECYHRRMWHSIPLTLFWFAYFGSLGVFYPYFALYLRENAGLTGTQVGMVLAISPLIGMIAQPLWGQVADRTGARTRVLAFLTLGTALGYLGLGARDKFSVDLAGDLGAGAGRHRGVSTDDFGESGDPARFRASCVRPGARLGYHRLLHSGSGLSLGADRLSATGAIGRCRSQRITAWHGLDVSADGFVGFVAALIAFLACRKKARWDGVPNAAIGASCCAIGPSFAFFVFPCLATFSCMGRCGCFRFSSVPAAAI